MNNKQSDLTINNLNVYDNAQLEKNECFVCINDKSVLQIENAIFENNNGTMFESDSSKFVMNRVVFEHNIGGILTIIPDILHSIHLSNVLISNNTANDDNSLFYSTNGNVSEFENSNIGLYDITFVENSGRLFVIQSIGMILIRNGIIVCLRMIM